jgi:Rad3-related DNA helicase
MTDERLIHELFPHRDGHDRPAYRPGQFEVIRDALAALDDVETTDVIVEAPTGAGKTSIAVTVARVLTHDFKDLVHCVTRDASGLMELTEYQVHMITSMKMLQDAYLGDDADIALVKGKASYECRHQPRLFVNEPLTCDDAEITYGRTCDAKLCPYMQARERAQWSAIALHNFDSFLWQAVRGNVFLPRRLLTLDEAHNSEEKIRQFTAFTLGPEAFQRAGLVWSPPPADIEKASDIGDWCHRQLLRLTEEDVRVENALKSLRMAMADNEYNGRQTTYENLQLMRQLVKLQRRVSSLVERLNRCLTTIEKTEWSVDTKLNGDLVFESVDASYFVPKTFYKFGRQRLHLSATFLNGGGGYTRSVRLNMAKSAWLTVPSTFPGARRPIIFRPAGDLGVDDWKVNLPTAIVEFKKILQTHSAVRGVVHCTSYDMARDIFESMAQDRRLLIYDKGDRADKLAAFLDAPQLPKNVVLLAVSLREGFDFKYDLARFQVIMRVPFPMRTRCMLATQAMADRRNYYSWRTALALVQAYGRGMRAVDDQCTTYVLDSRFKQFCKQQAAQLPEWFKEAISWS